MGNLMIPSSVVTIGNNAFSSCNSLSSVDIAAGTTSIGAAAFSYCRGLTSIFIPTTVSAIGNSAFEGCANLTSIVLPPAINGLGDSMFRFCSKLETVSFPSTITSIGPMAFSECSSLRNFIVPATVTSIGYDSFYKSGLTSIHIPGAVTNIGSRALSFCESLVSITVDPQNTSYSAANGLLLNKSETLVIQCPGAFTGACMVPATTTPISGGAFRGCVSPSSVSLPSGVTSIGGSAFENCTNLVGVNLPAGITVVNQWTFMNCLSLASVTIPPTVATIAYNAFANCDSLTQVTIPASVTSIAYGFIDCDNLTVIQVDPANPSYSSSQGVLFNKSKTELICLPGGFVGGYLVPSSVTEMGSRSAHGCRKLSGISFGSSVTTISSFAFESCGNLTSVTIPSSVTILGDFTFFNCGSLKSAVFLGSAPYAGYRVFDDTAPGFSVCFFNGASGFTTPTWSTNGSWYPSVNMGTYSPHKVWLVTNGFGFDSPLNADPNGDGVSLLLAYGLGLNPNLNLAEILPKPVVDESGLSLRFYSGNTDVGYAVQVSSNLKDWTSEGVILTAPDAEQFRTATIPLGAGSSRYMRLAIAR